MTGSLIGLALIPLLFMLVSLGLVVLFIRFIFTTFFKKAKEVYTDASKVALAEHGFQAGIAALNQRLASGEVDEAEYNRVRKIMEAKGPA